MRIAGIDPGLKGAAVLIAPGEYAALRMPVAADGKSIDGATLGAWLLVQEPDLVIVEKLGARNMFAAGGKAIRKAGNEFRFATGYGVIIGALQVMGLPYKLVQPMVWKARVLAGTDMGKQAAIDFVAREYPQIDLTPDRCRSPQDGIADAACLAVYGHLMYGSKPE